MFSPSHYLKKRTILISIFIVIAAGMAAQSDPKTHVQNIHSVKWNPLQISYSYEQSLSRQSVLNLAFTHAAIIGLNSESEFIWLIAPLVTLEPRWYYNYIRRFEKGKKNINNTANYLSLSMSYQSNKGIGKDLYSVRALRVVPKWGMKRSMGNHFVFDLSGGVGIGVAEEVSLFVPIIVNIAFGYTF